MAKRLPVRNPPTHEGKTGVTKFKELCIDTARSGHELGRFWASVTGCSYVEPSTPDATGDVVGQVVGDVEGMGIAICRVPEEKTVKHRVHLDVHTARWTRARPRCPPSTRLQGDPWTVLLDPEGGEFCAFVRDEPPAYRMYELIVDAVEPERITRWWADAFSMPVRNEGQSWWWLEDVPGMPFGGVVFQSVW